MNAVIGIAVPILLTFIVTDIVMDGAAMRRARKAQRAQRFTRSHWN